MCRHGDGPIGGVRQERDAPDTGRTSPCKRGTLAYSRASTRAGRSGETGASADRHREESHRLREDDRREGGATTSASRACATCRPTTGSGRAHPKQACDQRENRGRQTAVRQVVVLWIYEEGLRDAGWVFLDEGPHRGRQTPRGFLPAEGRDSLSQPLTRQLASHAVGLSATGEAKIARVPSPLGERVRVRGLRRPHILNGTMVWRALPSLSIESVTTSPAFSHFGSFMPSATPAGVPVVTTSPGSRTMNWLT